MMEEAICVKSNSEISPNDTNGVEESNAPSISRENVSRGLIGTGVSGSACSICGVKPAVYTFACCRWKHCGLECYKQHKNAAKTNPTDGSNNVGRVCGGPPHLHVDALAAMKSQRSSRKGFTEDRTENTQESSTSEPLACSLLSDREKLALELDPKLRKWYDLLTLRRAINSINTAPFPKDRLAYLLKNEEFAQFISDIMDVLDAGSEAGAGSTTAT